MEKVKYKSKYIDSDKTITEAQYVAEILIERRERKNGKGLPMFFWQDKRWKSLFKIISIQANTLIRLYGATILVRAVLSDVSITYLIFNKETCPKLKVLLDKIKREDEELAVRATSTEYNTNQKPLLPKQKKKGRLEDLE